MTQILALVNKSAMYKLNASLHSFLSDQILLALSVVTIVYTNTWINLFWNFLSPLCNFCEAKW